MRYRGIQGYIRHAIQEIHAVILATTSNLRKLFDNVKLFRQDL
jgi:hypothetical protein